jgi:hypothetical protein
MTTTASTLTEIPQGDMYVTQCVQLGATLDVRFMVDFQPEEALEPRVLYVVAEQVSDASRCAQFLLDRRQGNESVHLTRAGNTLTVTSAGGISAGWFSPRTARLRLRLWSLMCVDCLTRSERG